MEPKHNGCFDCGSKKDEFLKSVTCFRKDGKGRDKITNAALCEACFRKEQVSAEKL